MTGEVVKYKNELNSYYFGNLTEYELNIFYSVLYKLRDNKTLVVKFTIEELQELIQFKRKDVDFKEYAFKTFKKLTNIQITTRDPNDSKKLRHFTVLPMLTLDTETGEIEVQANEFLANFLNNITSNFTRIMLEDLNEIKGVYAKKLYQLLMQYKNTGWAQFDMDDFRLVMGIPKTYRQIDITDKVLKPALKELSKGNKIYLENLKYEKIAKKGRKISDIKFSFVPVNKSEGVKQDTQKTGNFVPLNHKIVNQKPSLKAQGSK